MRWLVSEIFDVLLQFTMLLWLAFGTVWGYKSLSVFDSVYGAVFGFVIALITGTLLFGTIFVILEIKDHLLAIRKSMEGLKAPVNRPSPASASAP